MKFGKRLAAEAARCWTAHYLDYKLVKRAIKDDIRAQDPTAGAFLRVLLLELHKVSSFFVDKAQEVEAALAEASLLEQSALARLQAEISELIKFVALNYLAVVKAIKKRNRHFKAAFGEEAVENMHPMHLLANEVFFTSPRLAALATRAELLAHQGGTTLNRSDADDRKTAGQADPAQLLQEYQCSICLDILRSPVVLTCAHRFCWGCLVAHYAAMRAPAPATADLDRDMAVAAAALASDSDDGSLQRSSSGGSGCSTHGSTHSSHQHHHSGRSTPCGNSGPAAGCGDCSGLDCGGGSATAAAAPAPESLVGLEKIVTSMETDGEADSGTFYQCPLCRKPQVLNIESLQVDPHLSSFVDELRLQLGSSASGDDESEADAEMVIGPEPEGGWLLPPQPPHHKGKLTVLLDLDGTLVSSYTPRRAPKLPPTMVAHLVGKGSSLNPLGVFVVERPGLHAFLAELAMTMEVVVYTAGLEEYAAPIIDAIDPTGTLISARLYRDATVKTEFYQCVKDMSRVGRPLHRTVLVDDTPLAFLHQPNNGVPVLGFRGDPDDRLLTEAVLPMLQTLSAAPDVRTILERRFDMFTWFRRHGYPEAIWEALQPKCTVAPPLSTASIDSAASDTTMVSAVVCQQPEVVQAAVSTKDQKETLLLFDFDKTLTDFDAGERLVGELAPELVPQLAALQMPANFVPLTNDVLSEIARRGVSRDKLLTTLQLMGAEVPPATSRMLLAAKRRRIDVKVLSDCNSVFISHILSGAKLQSCVQEVLTNGASFERLIGGGAAPALDGGYASTATGRSAAVARAASHKLVVVPRWGADVAPHGCNRCPENLCKGEEVRRIVASGRYKRVVFAGDGANDICAALQLRPQDTVLARAGHALAAYVAAASMDGSKLQPLQARVAVWENHEHLAALVAEHGC